MDFLSSYAFEVHKNKINFPMLVSHSQVKPNKPGPKTTKFQINEGIKSAQLFRTALISRYPLQFQKNKSHQPTKYAYQDKFGSYTV